MRSSIRRLSAALGLLAAALCSASDARADFDFQLATHVSGGWLRQTPQLESKAISTAARDIGQGYLRPRGGVALFGVGGDVDLTLDDRWKVPLLGGSLWWAVGASDAVVTSYDGSIARLRPWSTVRGDFLLPGIGRRWNQRRNMWAVAVRSGVSFVEMKGTVAAGAETTALELSQATFLLQLELEACRRLDPGTRVCLQIVPRVYEHELLNGLTFGLRMEFGR